MQRYKEFLKLPNKMHFNYAFRCIFNLCFIFKENSQHLFIFFFPCRPPGDRTPKDGILSSSANRGRNSAAAILSNCRQPFLKQSADASA
nr:MAG TPA: hypothetical protein [Caudoviricetes sp.]